MNVFDRCVDVFGNVSLSLFLAMALLSLELWVIKDLAIPLVIILGVQAVVMVLFAIFVVFRVMGKDYDAAVLAGGFCGFGMGATPTAVANMQAVTDRYGPSHKAFLIRSEEHTSELQSRPHLVCRLLLEKKNTIFSIHPFITPF